MCYLYKKELKGSTIRVYLSGVRNSHILRGFKNPLGGERLKLALKGTLVLSPPPNRKLPITFSILEKMFEVCKKRHDKLLIRTAITLAFFGCLRASELCISTKFDATTNLTISDVRLFKDEKYLILHLKKSKTDYLSEGSNIYIGCSESKVCSYCTMVRYLQTRCVPLTSPNDPLLIDVNGSVLSKTKFVDITRLLLASIGINPQQFSGHSYRAGSATTAGNIKFNEHEIKSLGRWKSNAYELYLRDPTQATKFAKRLATHQ